MSAHSTTSCQACGLGCFILYTLALVAFGLVVAAGNHRREKWVPYECQLTPSVAPACHLIYDTFSYDVHNCSTALARFNVSTSFPCMVRKPIRSLDLDTRMGTHVNPGRSWEVENEVLKYLVILTFTSGPVIVMLYFVVSKCVRWLMTRSSSTPSPQRLDDICNGGESVV